MGSHRRALRPGKEWPLTLVVVGFLAGLAVVATNHFRRGGVLAGAAVLAGAVLRLVLPTRTAGLLAVRSRALDVLALGLLGVGLVALTLAVPA